MLLFAPQFYYLAILLSEHLLLRPVSRSPAPCSLVSSWERCLPTPRRCSLRDAERPASVSHWLLALSVPGWLQWRPSLVSGPRLQCRSGSVLLLLACSLSFLQFFHLNLRSRDQSKPLLLLIPSRSFSLSTALRSINFIEIRGLGVVLHEQPTRDQDTPTRLLAKRFHH